MKRKTYFKPIAIPLYRTYTFLVVNMLDYELEDKLEEFIPDKEELRQLIEDSKVDKGYQSMTAFSDGYSIIRYECFDDAQDLNIMAHEAFHAACSIMRHVDIPLTEETEEAYAYLIGYITEQYEELFNMTR